MIFMDATFTKLYIFCLNNVLLSKQIVYYKVAGKILPLNMKTKGLWVAICLPILSSLSVIVTHVTMVDFKVSQVHLHFADLMK